MRIILATGKGGVGKTTIAAATAVRAARMGHRTLLTSTDPAHSLADALGLDLGDRPTPVAERLEAAQLDGHARLEEHWGTIRQYLVAVLEWGGVAEVQAEELSLLPGFEELFALIDIRRHAAAGRHDLLVVDCAPTAETLRLLSLPDALGWYLEHAFGAERGLARMVRPVLAGLTSMPLPSDELLGSAGSLYRVLSEVRDLLLDGERSTVRLVTVPERVVVAETRRTLTALQLFGYHVDAVVANRLLPDGVRDPHFARWKQRQSEHLSAIRRDFDAPVLTAPLASDEVVGRDGLDELALALHGDRDPAEVLHRPQPVSIERQGEQVCLTLALPFAEGREVDVLQRAEELYVRVGSYTRSLMLPALLRRSQVASAGLSEGRLVVRFDVPDDSGAGPRPVEGSRAGH